MVALGPAGLQPTASSLDDLLGTAALPLKGKAVPLFALHLGWPMATSIVPRQNDGLLVVW